VKIDLGCGKKKREGHLGLDNSATSAADVVCDFRRGLPLRNDSCDGAVADNLLEHLPDLIGFMNELWRVMRDGAEVQVIVPYYTSAGAHQDPTHVRFFTEKTFLYFNASLPYDYGFRGKFDITAFELVANPEFAREVTGVPFPIAVKYFWNAVSNLIVTLRADKKYRLSVR